MQPVIWNSSAGAGEWWLRIVPTLWSDSQPESCKVTWRVVCQRLARAVSLLLFCLYLWFRSTSTPVLKCQKYNRTALSETSLYQFLKSTWISSIISALPLPHCAQMSICLWGWPNSAVKLQQKWSLLPFKGSWKYQLQVEHDNFQIVQYGWLWQTPHRSQ